MAVRTVPDPTATMPTYYTPPIATARSLRRAKPARRRRRCLLSCITWWRGPLSRSSVMAGLKTRGGVFPSSSRRLLLWIRASFPHLAGTTARGKGLPSSSFLAAATTAGYGSFGGEMQYMDNGLAQRVWLSSIGGCTPHVATGFK